MADNSIEVLGQKFSYPTTWQGAISILVVCLCISFLAYTLDPDKIDSYAGWRGPQSDKSLETGLIKTNKTLNAEVVSLREQILSLADKVSLDDQEKKEIIKKLDLGQEEISKSYSGLIEAQEDRKIELRKITPISQEHQQILSEEQDWLDHQIEQIQVQEQLQKQ